MSRLRHQCHRNGCDSEAQWQMWMEFPSMTPGHLLQKLTVRHWIKTCDRHRKDAAEGFFAEQNLDQLADLLDRENMTMPHPRSIEISFARVRNGLTLADVLPFG